MKILLEEDRNGLALYFEALPEDTALDDILDDSLDDSLINDTAEKIETGELIYFCAKVSAEFKGLELGTDYLGACIYESLDAFIDDPGYIDDMKDTAHREAICAIEEIKSVETHFYK